MEAEELFSIDISYGGIFTITKLKELEDRLKEQILMIHCPTLIFSYLRREVSPETVEAGYQPLLINNVDFRVMYQQQKQEEWCIKYIGRGEFNHYEKVWTKNWGGSVCPDKIFKN